MLKKQLFLILALLCCFGCEEEDETVDITVMPPATTIGANTFGCLIDDWLYVGGRYSSILFIYNTASEKVEASVQVKKGTSISFTIDSPQEGKESTFTNTRFDVEKLKEGKVFITRFDREKQIISGTFAGGRISNGRFDVRYQEIERPEYPEETP